MIPRPGMLTALLLVLIASSPAHARTQTDLDQAWREYMTHDTGLAPSYTFPHAQCFQRAANAHGLPETLLLAVARGESDFEPTARSKANAYGVMQILWPGTAKHLGIHRLSELYDPCTNIEAGTRYLKELLAKYKGNLHLALAAYNYGPGRIATSGSNIPSGAEWYSGYIFRHLGYVLGDRIPMDPAVRSLYSELGRITVITFGEPYRAEAFIEQMEGAAPDLSLDWFRHGIGEFSVVLSYEGREEFARSANLLNRAGFPLN